MDKYTILIVDDEEIVLDITSKALMYNKYNIVTAKNGVDALEKLKLTDVHLIISDQKMPEMDGLEFLKRVRIEYPEIITIMLTGYAEIDTAVKAINEAGVYKFILKPWNVFDLRTTVWRALELKQVVMERDALLGRIKSQEAIFSELEKKHPGITKVDRDQEGDVILEI